MIISTYTEYDENGNVKSQTTTQYEDSDIDTGIVGEIGESGCNECPEDMTEDIDITTEELFAIAMRSVGLIDSICDPRVTQFAEALNDLQDLLWEDEE